MSLRKSPTMNPARIEANRRIAQKSTSPRTACGKARSRMNGLRTGKRSVMPETFLRLLLDAPPCSIARVAQAFLTPEQAVHPVFAETLEIFRRAEGEVVSQCVLQPARLRAQEKNPPRFFRGKLEC